MIIKQNQLAQYRHVKFLVGLENHALAAYRLVAEKMIADIKKLIKAKKLKKSDDDGLGRGWSGETPSIKIDLDGALSKVIDKYIKALRWLMLGDMAGKDAKAAAEEIGLKGKTVPGMLQSAYLQSIDAHREHYKDLTGDNAPKIPVDIMKATLEKIVERNNRFAEELFAKFKNRTLDAVDRQVNAQNMENQYKVHQEAHDLLDSETADKAVELAVGAAKGLSTKKVGKELEDAVESFEKDWTLSTQGDLALSSAMGTHQSMLEIYGPKDGGMRVVWMTMENESVCTWCDQVSKDSGDNYKYYTMIDFKPSGYNYGKKKANWAICIPPSHPNCKCQLIYVPHGMSVSKDGTLMSNKKNEKS